MSPPGVKPVMALSSGGSDPRDVMVHVRFKYRDEFCRDGKFREQECLVRSVDECKKIYGLDQCEHEILEVKEV